jgi:2-(1,2-epoxy-1,2-dihydrophenyl)acetyl-CoA isomerase
MSADDGILVDRSDGVATVTLNRPERKNAIDNAMWRELQRILREIGEHPTDRAVVLTGAGDAFCSGTGLGPKDIEEYHREPGVVLLRRIGEAALALHMLPQPTIAKVNGVAVGAGCNLALGCDLIVASETAAFSEIFSRRGLAIDSAGSWLLPRLIGLHRAKELAFFGDRISAQQALEMGLVNRVVPHDHLDAVVDEWAHRLAAGPTIALSLTKRMLNNSLSGSITDALEDEARSQHVTMSTEDVAEGLQAFVEKRPPTFRGR